MKNVMKKAHEITKKIIRKGDSYKATFRLALSFAHSLVKRGVDEIAELKGSEKQIKWAYDIREKMLMHLNNLLDAVVNTKTDTAKIYRANFRRRAGVKKSEVGGTREAVTEALAKILNGIKKDIYAIDSAKFFIDNRFNDFEEIFGYDYL